MSQKAVSYVTMKPCHIHCYIIMHIYIYPIMAQFTHHNGHPSITMITNFQYQGSE